jgi:hypothetical protein
MWLPPPGYYTLPLDPSLAAWWAADSLLGANSTLPSDSSSVSIWCDLSGNNHHVRQTTGANQPTFRTNQLNGKPAVYFDGGDVLTKTNDNLLNGITNKTIFSVIKGDALSTPYIWFLISTSSNAARTRMVATAGNVAALLDNNVNDNTGVSQSVTITNWNLITAYRNGSSINISINQAPFSTAVNTLTPVTDGSTLTIGAPTNLISAFSGYIAEIIVYSRTLSSSEITTVNSYLKNKYGI